MTGRGGATDSDRAQMLPDFVIGIAIFLVTIAFIVGFIPQMTAPYQEQEKPVVAERIADDVSGSLLGRPGSSSGLNLDCTRAFFARSDATGCPFDAADTVNEQLGVSDRHSVNVRLVSTGSESEVLCADGGSIGTCGTERLAVGPSVPQDGRSVATTHRVVHVDGNDAVLEVRVW